ncbi:MAG: hypothetical protein FWD97_09835 [Defluviitaleaceae bacterium]|nr:hypothetical protein [Defluviitaleaceae bacterium]
MNINTLRGRGGHCPSHSCGRYRPTRNDTANGNGTGNARPYHCKNIQLFSKKDLTSGKTTGKI